jgi:hypothetical protein
MQDPTSDWFPDTEQEMVHIRKEDSPVSTVLRVVDWKWLAGIVIAIFLWGVNQWVQYNALLKGFSEQGELIVKMTSEIKLLTTQLGTTNTDNMKQDFELIRLKDKMERLESIFNQAQVISTIPNRK